MSFCFYFIKSEIALNCFCQNYMKFLKWPNTTQHFENWFNLLFWQYSKPPIVNDNNNNYVLLTLGYALWSRRRGSWTCEGRRQDHLEEDCWCRPAQQPPEKILFWMSSSIMLYPFCKIMDSVRTHRPILKLFTIKISIKRCRHAHTLEHIYTN